jgi:hypothetical protein
MALIEAAHGLVERRTVFDPPLPEPFRQFLQILEDALLRFRCDGVLLRLASVALAQQDILGHIRMEALIHGHVDEPRHHGLVGRASRNLFEASLRESIGVLAAERTAVMDDIVQLFLDDGFDIIL